jgi:Tfp pilus assembly protein PilX
MKSINDNNQAGVVLVVVLMLLTLLGLVGVTFVYYASQNDCSRNPTIETRDGRCVKEIGPGRH